MEKMVLEENLEFNDSSEYFLLPGKDFNLFFFSRFSTDSETESPNKDSDDSSDFSSSLENFRGRAGLMSFRLSWLLEWLIFPARESESFNIIKGIVISFTRGVLG